MKIVINDKTYDVPFHLAYITLGQFVDYYERFGKGLLLQRNRLEAKDYVEDLRQQGIEPTQDDIDVFKATDYYNLEENEALAWYSFWTGHDLFSVRNEPLVQPVIAQYHALRPGLFDERELNSNITTGVEFAGANWKVQNFKSNSQQDLTHDEKRLARDIMRHVHHVSEGRIDHLPFLCAVFFRKDGEAFNQALTEPGSERMKLLESLPMNIAQSIALLLREAAQKTDLETCDIKINFSIN